MSARLLSRRLVVSAALVVAVGCTRASTAPTTSVTFTTLDLVVGAGAPAANGATVSMDYTIWLYNATKAEGKGLQVDTSAGKDPVSFQLGAGQVIYGLDVGMPGMKTGGTRRLTIPPLFAYGAQGSGVIPGNAAIVFEVTLRSVK